MSGIANQAKKVILKRAGRAYLAGPTLSEALGVADRAHRRGRAATLSYWNGEGDTRADIAARAAAMVGAAGARASWCDVAVTVPVLDFEPPAVARLAEQCADHDVRMWVALASHDDWVLQHACERLAASDTPFEIQLLHGVSATRALDVARSVNVSIRFYAPCGHPCLVYPVRTMWENRRLVGRFAQDVVFGGPGAAMLRG